MAIKMIDCHFEKNGTGLHAPTSVDISMTGTTFKDNGKALDIYVDINDVISLGFKPDTPQEYVKEVFELLSKIKDESKEQKVEAIKDHPLFKFITNGKAIVETAIAVIKLYKETC